MNSSNLFRWSGLAAIMAGVVYPITWIADLLIKVPNSTITALGFVAEILLIFGLMGIYGSQIKESGSLGFFGFLLATISICFSMGQTWLPESGQLVDVAGVLGPLIGITGVPAYILLGMGTLKAGILPRWTAWMWIIGYSLSFVSMLAFVAGLAIGEYFVALGILIWSVGLAGAGARLWSEPVEPAIPQEALT
jgi:hypothetical protein